MAMLRESSQPSQMPRSSDNGEKMSASGHPSLRHIGHALVRRMLHATTILATLAMEDGAKLNHTDCMQYPPPPRGDRIEGFISNVIDFS